MHPTTLLLLTTLTTVSASALLPRQDGTQCLNSANILQPFSDTDTSLLCLYLTTDVEWAGEGQNLCQKAGVCSPSLPTGLTSNSSSAGPDASIACYLFTDNFCTGLRSPAIRRPGYADLSEIGFGKRAKSWGCWRECVEVESTTTVASTSTSETGVVILKTVTVGGVSTAQGVVAATGESITITFSGTQPVVSTSSSSSSSSGPVVISKTFSGTGEASTSSTGSSTSSSSSSTTSGSSTGVITPLSNPPTPFGEQSTTSSSTSSSSSEAPPVITISIASSIEATSSTATPSSSGPPVITLTIASTIPASSSISSGPSSAPPVITITASSSTSTPPSLPTPAGIGMMTSKMTLTHTFADGSTTLVTTQIVEPIETASVE